MEKIINSESMRQDNYKYPHSKKKNTCSFPGSCTVRQYVLRVYSETTANGNLRPPKYEVYMERIQPFNINE